MPDRTRRNATRLAAAGCAQSSVFQGMQVRWFRVQRITAFVLLVAGPGCDPAALLTFEVTGADHLRPLAMVTFDTDLEPGGYAVHNRTGEDVPLQVDQEGRATLFIQNILPEEVTRWTVHKEAENAYSVTAERGDDQIVFRASGREVTAYRFAKGEMPRTNIPEVYRRDGYLHPVRAPSGTGITDDYPPDHIHHHGIWAAWTNTIFQGRTPDFWNMGRATGRVEVASLDRVWNGSVFAGLKARHRYVDMMAEKDVTVLHESWNLRVYGIPVELNLIDLTLIQTAATDSTLRLPVHRYGGVGVRGHRSWVGEEGVEFVTSEGRTRENGHATRGRWCHVGGRVEGRQAGIAVLSPPENQKAPQPMRIHPTEPFFNFAPTQASELSITPDAPAVWKYRFVTYDGPHDSVLLDALWEDYANPLAVHIVHSSSP